MTATKYPEIFARLAEKLPEESLRRKKGKGGQTLVYMTSRGVMNRLDQVLGPENWRDRYRQEEDGEMMCWLTITLPDGTKVTKCDVGMGQGPDAGVRRKAIYADALKRAAVKFGIGRYLYRDGMPDYVHEYLDGNGKPQARRKAEPPRDEPTRHEPRARPGLPKPTPDTTTRAEVNAAFRHDARGPVVFEPAKDPRSKEQTTLWRDRIGARGFDVRTWDDIRDQEVDAVNEILNRYRVEECRLLAIDHDKLPVNRWQILNHLVGAAVDAGADDPNTHPFGTDGKRKPIGDGKKSAFVAGLLGDRETGWREWARAEIREYLGAKLEDARSEAWSEYSGEPIPVTGHESQPQLQLAVVGLPGEAWQPGRE